MIRSADHEVVAHRAGSAVVARRAFEAAPNNASLQPVGAGRRRGGRNWLLAIGAGVAVEAVTIAVPWSDGGPSTLFVVLKVAACAVNAVGSIVAITRLRLMTGGGSVV